jgi:phosphoglycerol transferase MdoB-like AlkP superfamily enzyme
MDNFKESVQLIFRSLRRFLSLGFILASILIVVRLFELLIISKVYEYPPGSTVNILIGLKYDLILYLQISAILLIPFLFISYFSPKIAKFFIMVISVLLIFGDFLLLQYFFTAKVPLGADLFSYSIDEMRHTVGASGSINFVFYFFVIICLILMVRIFIIHVYFKIKPWAMALLTMMMVGSLLPLKQLNPDASKFDNEFGMFIASNKLGFFFHSMANHYLHFGKQRKGSDFLLTETVSSVGNEFSYLDPDYPFLHKESTPDNLGKYFELKATPPNIVILIIESLGRAYSGKGAYLGSFTPFLDSLMDKSLYWENCLSTSGRTFQVLPSLLASVPFGRNGFAELKEKMPAHLSLLNVLKKQAGYNSVFVYGGDAGFDKMDIFLNRQGIDHIIDIKDFDGTYTKLPSSSNGFSWGYGDKEILRRYLEVLGNRDSLRLDLVLTLAMHDPFDIPDQQYYIEKFETRLGGLDLSDKTKTFDLQCKKQFASMLYFDESLRYFFDEIKQMPSFANTIFIITGDHRMPEIPISTQIDRFHVPLVIYSPLLKESQKFSSVVTHFDLTPSLLALFDKQNFIKRSSVAAWVGHGLDNSATFRNLYSYPIMRNKNEILDFIDSEYFLSGNTLYHIYPNLDIEPLDSLRLEQHLKDKLDNFMQRNNFACENDKLIPDSIIIKVTD